MRVVRTQWQDLPELLLGTPPDSVKLGADVGTPMAVARTMLQLL